MIEFQNKERKFFYVSQIKRELEKLIEGFWKKVKRKGRNDKKKNGGKIRSLLSLIEKEREQKRRGNYSKKRRKEKK